MGRMARAVAALTLMAMLAVSGAGMAQAAGEIVKVPGGGTVATPQGYTWDRPVLLLDPTDFLLFLRGRKTNIGGNASFRAALAVGDMREVAEPFLPRVAGKLPDADWATVTHYAPAWEAPGAGAWEPLDVPGADHARIFRLQLHQPGLFRSRAVDAFVAEAAAGTRRAALFGLLEDYDAQAAAALLAEALRAPE